MIKRYLCRISGTIVNASTGAPHIVLQLPKLSQSPVWILSFHIVRTSGTAVNWVPVLGQTSGFTTGDIDTRMLYASAAVTTAINDVFVQPIPCMTDANGRLYFNPVWNAGVNDNNAAYEFWFEYPSGS